VDSHRESIIDIHEEDVIDNDRGSAISSCQEGAIQPLDPPQVGLTYVGEKKTKDTLNLVS
jgi:hypothetical protein